MSIDTYPTPKVVDVHMPSAPVDAAPDESGPQPGNRCEAYAEVRAALRLDEPAPPSTREGTLAEVAEVRATIIARYLAERRARLAGRTALGGADI